MYRLRDMRAKSDQDALKDLMMEEEKALGVIFSDTRHYHHEELTVGNIIYLQRRIVDMLKCLIENRMDTSTPEDKTLDSEVDALGKQLSTLSIN